MVVLVWSTWICAPFCVSCLVPCWLHFSGKVVFFYSACVGWITCALWNWWEPCTFPLQCCKSSPIFHKSTTAPWTPWKDTTWHWILWQFFTLFLPLSLLSSFDCDCVLFFVFAFFLWLWLYVLLCSLETWPQLIFFFAWLVKLLACDATNN